MLLKAIARNKQDRFGTAEEFLLALEQGANRPLRVPRRMPLAQRSPRLLLGAFLVVSLMLNFALAWLLIRR
jgi:protein phosphatase